MTGKVTLKIPEPVDIRGGNVQVNVKKAMNGIGFNFWVNVDGVCKLRVYSAFSVEIEDTNAGDAT